MRPDVKELEKRIKTLEDALGMGSEGAKNIHLILTTVRLQGDEIAALNDQIIFQNAAILLRNEFINKDPARKKDFETFLQKKEEATRKPAPAPGKAPALEIKEKEIIHAFNMVTPQWTLCEGLAKDSRMVKHGEYISCPKCIEALETERRKAAPQTEHVPPGPVPEPKPKKYKCQNCGAEIDESGECDTCSGITPDEEPKGCDPETCKNPDAGGKIERQ